MNLEWTTKPTLTLMDAAELLGIGRSTAYTAVREGTFPTRIITIGGRYIIPTTEMMALLGIETKETK